MALNSEFFWGCELNKEKKEIHWEPEVEDETEEAHNLILKTAVIGESSDGELNVVEIETLGFSGETIKQPLFHLKLGEMNQVRIEVYVPKVCSLRLVSGSGPVYISGQHVIEYAGDEEDDEYESVSEHLDAKVEDAEEEDGEEEEEKEDEMPEPAKDNKRKLQNGKASNVKKMPKMDISTEDENNDPDFEAESPEKPKKPAGRKSTKKAKK